MKLASRFLVGSIAALTFTAAVAEEAARVDRETRHVIARADVLAETSPAPVALEALPGRYDAAADVVFVVDYDGDALTIELPDASGVVRLYPAETRNTFAARDDTLRVVFEADASGRVLGLLLYTPNSVFAASKAPVKRGIVTVHDVPEEALSTLVRAF